MDVYDVAGDSLGEGDDALYESGELLYEGGDDAEDEEGGNEDGEEEGDGDGEAAGDFEGFDALGEAVEGDCDDDGSEGEHQQRSDGPQDVACGD